MNGVLRDAVWAALDTVLDPELDEPITSLEFVESCTVSVDGVATVRLRLPTFFCSPNFSWFMVADAHDAVSAVPGVTRADIALEDHFVSEVINQGRGGPVRVRRGVPGRGGAGAGRPARDVLPQGRAGRPGAGRPAAGQRRGRRPRSWPRCGSGSSRRRATSTGCGPAGPSVGLPHDDDAPLLLHPDGETVTAAQVPLHLRRARLTGVSIEANGGTCRDLLAKRYAATS